jgi:hypothetical protein
MASTPPSSHRRFQIRWQAPLKQCRNQHSHHTHPKRWISYTLSLSLKLDESNFLLWSQQVEGVITAHNFSSGVYTLDLLGSWFYSGSLSHQQVTIRSTLNFFITLSFSFPNLRPYNKHKLQLRSTECVYLGISPQHKGHMCFSPSSRIFISKDVIFNESEFPFPLHLLNFPPPYTLWPYRNPLIFQ